MLSNNRGFSLVEVLVTVGLIGVLVGISVPAYNKYKEGTNTMALKADLGNAAKAYGAYDAVNGTFCAHFDTVGFNVNDSSPVWKRNAFIGFGDVASDQCPGVNKSEVQYVSKGVDATTVTDENECTINGGKWDSTAAQKCTGTKAEAFEYNGQLKSAVNCKLQQDTFTMGSSSYSLGNDGKTNHIITNNGKISVSADDADCVEPAT